MLETDDHEQVANMLQQLPQDVCIPEEWTDFFEADGILPTVSDDHRRFARRFLRKMAVCEVLPTLPAIGRHHGCHCVMLRDISRGGIGFLHFEQLFPNEKIAIWTGATKLPMTVCRCVKRCDKGYEVGARFG